MLSLPRSLSILGLHISWIQPTINRSAFITHYLVIRSFVKMNYFFHILKSLVRNLNSYCTYRYGLRTDFYVCWSTLLLVFLLPCYFMLGSRYLSTYLSLWWEGLDYACQCSEFTPVSMLWGYSWWFPRTGICGARDQTWVSQANTLDSVLSPYPTCCHFDGFNYSEPYFLLISYIIHLDMLFGREVIKCEPRITQV